MADGLCLVVTDTSTVRPSSWRHSSRYALAAEHLKVGPLLVELMSRAGAPAPAPERPQALLKTVMMREGVAAQLDPGFELVPLLVPYASAGQYEP
jgi:hypothetical protein